MTFTVEEGRPVIRLGLPLPDGAPPAAAWSLLNGHTMVVVDGPGDEGYLLLRRLPDGTDFTPADWDQAVGQAGGAHVVFGAQPDAPGVFATELPAEPAAADSGLTSLDDTTAKRGWRRMFRGAP